MFRDLGPGSRSSWGLEGGTFEMKKRSPCRPNAWAHGALRTITIKLCEAQISPVMPLLQRTADGKGLNLDKPNV